MILAGLGLGFLLRDCLASNSGEKSHARRAWSSDEADIDDNAKSPKTEVTPAVAVEILPNRGLVSAGQPANGGHDRGR